MEDKPLPPPQHCSSAVTPTTYDLRILMRASVQQELIPGLERTVQSHALKQIPVQRVGLERPMKAVSRYTPACKIPSRCQRWVLVRKYSFYGALIRIQGDVSAVADFTLTALLSPLGRNVF